MAGKSNEKKVDASIMPAALLIISANVPVPTFLQKTTKSAPAAVNAHVNVVAIRACNQPSRL